MCPGKAHSSRNQTRRCSNSGAAVRSVTAVGWRVVEALESRTLLTAVLSAHYDLAGTGVDSTETLLTPSTVNTTNFGKQFATPLDGQAYAQPLYVPGVNITSGSQQGTHNVIYVVTENDDLYAIDSNGGNVLWRDSFSHHVQPADQPSERLVDHDGPQRRCEQL